MLPDFGCGIHDLVFAPNNPVDAHARGRACAARAGRAMSRASTCWAWRPKPAPAEPNLLLMRVDYRIRANNAVGNLVYPFYITEAA